MDEYKSNEAEVKKTEEARKKGCYDGKVFNRGFGWDTEPIKKDPEKDK